MFKKGKKSEVKFCPVCGTQLGVEDSFCIRCGYSFQQRVKKRRGVKWKNLVFIAIILVLVYLGIRYMNGEPLLPTSIGDLFGFNSTNVSK